MDNVVPKILAIFLPQFYETEDNNKWWGKGFTDWDPVRSAEKLFPRHEAPWNPLNNNYYNLNTYDTMAWQAQMAEKYEIDGFCFYHYYFENGKKELEQPAENLLKWTDINMPFCFNWANESWIRSWSKIEGNVWSEKFECSEADSSKGVLVKQEYGDETEWERHFEYLLPFFKDKRYIRINNKPVFIFYRPGDIKPLKKMAAFWRSLAKTAGLDGLYLIGANENISDSGLDAALVYEPRTSINKLNRVNKVYVENGVRCFEYTDIWEEIIKDHPFVGCKTFYSGITGYDDTPRRGHSGECIVNRSPHIFEDGIKKLILKSKQCSNELLFINAWNEWGEGMYLEPDEQKKFAYLEAIRRAKTEIKKSKEFKETNLENMNPKNLTNMDEFIQLRADVKKYKIFVELLNKWLDLERMNKIHFTEFFQENAIHTVAIYGMAMLGKQLYQQLTHENIMPKFGIDRYVGQYGADFHIIRPEEEYPEVDAIIVTTYDDTEVIELLQRKTNAVILRLQEVIEYFGDSNEV